MPHWWSNWRREMAVAVDVTDGVVFLLSWDVYLPSCDVHPR